MTVHILDMHDLLTETWLRVNRLLDSEECKKYMDAVTCPPEYANFLKAKELVLDGKLDEAVTELQHAQKLNATLPADPKTIVNRMQAHFLLESSQISAWNGDIDGVIDAEKRACLEPSRRQELARCFAHRAKPKSGDSKDGSRREDRRSQGRVCESSRDSPPSLKQDAITLNHLCWFGSLWGYPSTVMEFCNQAVSLRPGIANFADSRGVAPALSGPKRWSAAATDFEKFVKSNPVDEGIVEDENCMDQRSSSRPKSHH